ncbi:MAG: hypothetical protein H6754_05775 [Candidatus Omnitrophica bacterium]|nr:hypothetical protein [Candidatus Omnitrophota bacterium]
MKKAVFILLVLFTLSAKNAWAVACSTPGVQRYTSGNLEFCDGSNWKLLGLAKEAQSPLAACAQPGLQGYSTFNNRMDFCSNNNNSYKLNCRINATDTCTAIQAGTQRYNTTLNVMQYCNSTNWVNLGNVAGFPCCPDGFIPVAADSTVGVNTDFCVAKYHMKATTNAGAPVANGINLGNAAGHYPESRATDTPWSNLSFNDAFNECQSLGTGYHLITNPEWMAIAKSIENNRVNWSGNAVGSGHIPTGHSDANPNNYLEANNTDTLGCTGTNNNNCLIQANNDFWQKRTFVLSNDEVIWDMAGNIHSWVSTNTNGDSFSYIRTSCNVAPCTKQLNDPYNTDPVLPLPAGKYISILAPTMFPPNAQASTNKFGFLPANDADWVTGINYGATPYDQRGFGMITWLSGGFAFFSDRAIYRGGVYNLPLTGLGERVGGLYSAWVTQSRSSNFSDIGFRCTYTPPAY